VLCHFIYYFLHSYVYCVLYYSLVDIPYYILNHSELLKQFSPSIKYFLRKNVLFPIDPKVRKALLSGIQYFS